MRLAWPALLLTAVAPAMLEAQAVIASAKPDEVSVTVYRAPNGTGEIDGDHPHGVALITERRTVTLPAGSAVIRFEGVAGNILPEHEAAARQWCWR